MTATWSPRSFICRSASRACSPDSARTILFLSPYLLRRSRAIARDTLGSSSTVTITGRSSASPAGRVMTPSYLPGRSRLPRDSAPHGRLARRVLRALRPPFRAADDARLHQIKAIEEGGHLCPAPRLDALRHELVEPAGHGRHRRRLDVGG